MIKLKAFILCLSISFFTGAAQAQTIEQTQVQNLEQQSCIANTYKMLDYLNSIPIQQEFVATKDQQCRNIAKNEQFKDEFWDRVSSNRNKSQIAYGETIIQQSIDNNSTNRIDVIEYKYKACMSNPNIKTIQAKPISKHFEEINFSLNQIKTLSCPSEFNNLFQSYKQAFGAFTETLTNNQTITANDLSIITKKPLPSNKIESNIIEQIAAMKSAMNTLSQKYPRKIN